MKTRTTVVIVGILALVACTACATVTSRAGDGAGHASPTSVADKAQICAHNGGRYIPAAGVCDIGGGAGGGM